MRGIRIRAQKNMVRTKNRLLGGRGWGGGGAKSKNFKFSKKYFLGVKIGEKIDFRMFLKRFPIKKPDSGLAGNSKNEVIFSSQNQVENWF